MTEDQVLHELGRLAKEEREAERIRLDERWDRLAAGTLTAEEDAELRALAAASPEAREAYEAFRPLGADFQARVVAEINRRKKKERFHFFDFLLALPPPARWLTAAGTVAAGLLLLFWPPAPQPDYIAGMPSGGIQSSRGEEGLSSKPRQFPPGSTFDWTVSPQHPVKDPVEARAFLTLGAEIVPWEPEPRLYISDQGAVRLQGTIGEKAPKMVWIVVSRPGEKLPPSDDLLAKLRAGQMRDDDWQAIATDLRVRELPPP